MSNRQTAWTDGKLGDLFEIVREQFDPQKSKVELPYIGLEHIGQGSLTLTGIGRSTEVVSGKSRFKPSDTLFGKLRPYFRKVILAHFEGVCSTDITVLRPSPETDPKFLFYRMASQEVVDAASQGDKGTRMPRADWDFLSKFPISIPPPEIQRKIGEILGSLDDKIELNRRMNETLEAMARAIFKSWFVDFDPVRAKAAGRDTGLPSDIASLFPDSFADSELGKIPKGWKVGSFSETVDIISGGTPKTAVAEYWDGDIPWFTVKDAPRQSDVFVIDTERHITQSGIDGSATEVLPIGATIISARGTVGSLAVVGTPMAMNQSRSPASPLPGLTEFKEI